MKDTWKAVAVCFCCLVFEATAQVAVGPLENGTVSATLFAGSDQGAQVNAALTASSNLKVSAEGFTGLLTSASNPIPMGQRGKLLLGCNQVWQTKASWVFPSGFVTEGCGWNAGTSTDTGTVIRAITGFLTTGVPVGCTGTTGTCGSGNEFGTMIRGVVFDCNGIASCIGFQNQGGQEGCCLEHVKIINFPNIGLDIETSGVQNSHYYDLYIQELGAYCTASTLALKINTNAPNVTVQRATLTYNSGSGSCTTAPPYIAKISAVAFTGIDMHFEPGSSAADTSGLCIGCDANSGAINLIGLSFAGFGLGSSSCESFATCGILISSLHSTGYVTVSGINCSSSGLNYCLYDDTNGFNLPLSSGESKIGLYSSGNSTLHNSLSTNLYLPQTSTQVFAGYCSGVLDSNTNDVMFGLGGTSVSTVSGALCADSAAAVYPIVTTSGYLSNLYVKCGTGPNSGTVTFTVLKNGVTQSLACSMTSASGGTCNDNINIAGHTVSVSPGDGVGLRMRGTAAGEVTANCAASMEKH